MIVYKEAEVVENEEIAEGIWSMYLYAPEIAKNANPGQFINLYLSDNSHMLPRPICIADAKNDIIRIIYRLVGKGTKQISLLKKSNKIRVMGPLGNGYTISNKSIRNIIIGGGLGIPSVLLLAGSLKGRVEAYLGYSGKPFLVKEFIERGADVRISTLDGNCGLKGSVIDLLERESVSEGQVFACGPKSMLKAVSEWADRNSLDIQVSMEERMACGLGACLGCAVKVKKNGGEDSEYKRVCKDGPVFWGKEIIWND